MLFPSSPVDNIYGYKSFFNLIYSFDKVLFVLFLLFPTLTKLPIDSLGNEKNDFEKLLLI